MTKEARCGNCEFFETPANYTFMSIKERGEIGKCKTTGKDVLSTSRPTIEPFDKSSAATCMFREKVPQPTISLFIISESLELIDFYESSTEHQVYPPPINNYIH